MQRVSSAAVTVDGEEVGAIGPGLCAFVGVTHADGPAEAERLADKLWHLRIFAAPDDPEARMDVAVGAVGGRVLVVSQFTLYGDTSRGRRPSWVDAARPEHAEPLVDAVVAALARAGRRGGHRPLRGRHGRRPGQRRPRHPPPRGLTVATCVPGSLSGCHLTMPARVDPPEQAQVEPEQADRLPASPSRAPTRRR